jgi:MFS family permease
MLGMLRRADPESLWADRDWRRYWASRVVSYAGATIIFVAAPILVYSLTGSALLTGVTTATEGLPYLLFGLVAGALSDRVDRLRLMVRCDLVNAAVLATVPIAAAFGHLTAGHVIVVGFVSMTVFVFFDSANFGALPALVGRDRIGAANSAVWGTTQVFDVVLPGLVGALVAFIAPSSLYWVEVFTFLASALLLRGIGRALSGDRPLETHRLRDDVLTGVRWLWAHPTLRVMTFVGTSTAFAMGALLGQLVPFADRVLDIRQGDLRLGAVFAAFSLGGLIGALAHRWTRPFSPARISLVSVTAMAALLFVIPAGHDWRVTLALVFAFGIVDLVAVINVITFRQEETPEDMQGRVNTTGRMLSWGLGSPVGALLGGVVASRHGPAAGMYVGAAVLAVGIGAAWFTSLARVPARRPAAALAS